MVCASPLLRGFNHFRLVPHSNTRQLSAMARGRQRGPTQSSFEQQPDFPAPPAVLLLRTYMAGRGGCQYNFPQRELRAWGSDMRYHPLLRQEDTD